MRAQGKHMFSSMMWWTSKNKKPVFWELLKPAPGGGVADIREPSSNNRYHFMNLITLSCATWIFGPIYFRARSIPAGELEKYETKSREDCKIYIPQNLKTIWSSLFTGIITFCDFIGSIPGCPRKMAKTDPQITARYWKASIIHSVATIWWQLLNIHAQRPINPNAASIFGYLITICKVNQTGLNEMRRKCVNKIHLLRFWIKPTYMFMIHLKILIIYVHISYIWLANSNNIWKSWNFLVA